MNEEQKAAERLVEQLRRPTMPPRHSLREAQQTAAKELAIPVNSSEAELNDARHAVVLAISALLHNQTEDQKCIALDAAEDWLRHIRANFPRD